MSQFYSQFPTNTQQQNGKNNAKDCDEWSYVQLTNGSSGEGAELQKQQQQQQQQPYLWYQQQETATDPYSAAAFEGFRASSGGIGTTKSWQTSATPNNLSRFLSQQQWGSVSKEERAHQIHKQKNEQVSHLYGIHQPILDSERKISGLSVEDKEVINGKNIAQYVKLELVSDDVEGNVVTNALLPTEKMQTESGVPAATLAQVTPMMATSMVAGRGTSFSPDSPTFPVSTSANIAFSLVSNDNSSALQPVIPSSQTPQLASVASPCSAPSSLVDGNGGAQNAIVIEGAQTASKFVLAANHQEPCVAMKPVEGKDSAANSVSNQSKKTVKDASSPPTDGAQESLAQNELRQILKTSTPAERSIDSTAPEDSISRPNEKHRDSRNVRDRYLIIRQQYPEVIKRLDRLRMETHHLDWRPIKKTQLLEIDENSHRISNRRQRNSMIALDCKVDRNLKDVEPVSDSRPSSKINHSYTLPERMSSEDGFAKNHVYYGEDFVNSLRRNRYTRIREHDFLSRGTKSEMGEIGPYRGPAVAKYRQMMQHTYDFRPSSGYQQHEYYPSGRQSLGPHLGRRVAHELAMMQDDGNILTRRPQSSFDAPYPKYQQSNDLAQDSHNREARSFGSGEESSGSDSEIARIHNEQEMARLAAATRNSAMSLPAPNEFYYFGVIQLPQERVEYIMRKLPPPPEYFQLPAIEKAAYLFYCVLYRHHYLPVDLFHKKFNREYFSYMCEGDSAEVALWKICKHTQEEYIAKRSIKQMKAYELSQKQQFSDEHETVDSRQSERGSRCDAEDSDQLSTDSAAKEPVKFRVPHSFLTFGVGGKVVMLNVQNSVNVLEIRDLKSLFGKNKLLLVSNAIESFRGPLIAGFTPTHSVHLYVQRQIEVILKSEAYLSNPSDSLESDCLLIWQLLEMLVQQQGRVTGPDLSRLLMATCDVAEQRWPNEEKSRLHTPVNFNEGYDRFTQLLLGGHVKEALENAIKDGLYCDAMILARRMCANEPHELEKVEMAFLSHRSELNPLMTLFSVANGLPAPVLTSSPMHGASSWRSHAAVVLANLNTPSALGTVYQLGCVLARRGLHAAADFCFLAVSLLMPSYNPFKTVPISDDMNADDRRHITLIHATLPGEEMNSGFLKGFSITDFHATEIFQYSVKLANYGFLGSLAYQLHRLNYAEMVSEFGNSPVDAFRYCVEIAKEIWDRRNEIDVEELERLYELAERLKVVAGADSDSTIWLPTLRSFIDKQKIVVDESKEVENNDARTLTEPDVEDVGMVMASKTSQINTVGNFTENSEVQVNDFASMKALGSERVEWQMGQEAATTSTVNIKQEEANSWKTENNEYHVELGQLREKVATYSNTNVSYSGFSQASIRDSVESDVTTHTTVISPSLRPANEQISHEAVQSFYGDVTHQSRGIDSVLVAECVENSNSTSTNSHENTPRRSVDYLERKVSSEMTTIGTESQIQRTMRSVNVSPVIKKPENSFSSEQQSNAIRTNEKMHNEGKIVNDHRQNSGLFSKLKAKIVKAIPSDNEMILPDDKHPSIVWDPILNRYVGEGIEEESVQELPPSIATSSEKLNGSVLGKVDGLTAARLSGGSRYFNPLIETSSSKPATHAAHLLPPVRAAATFGFIPSMPDENEASAESPFSIQSDPLSKETETAE